MTGIASKGFVDAHTHLSSPEFLEKIGLTLDDYLAQARVHGIDRFVLAGTDPADWERQIALLQKYPDRFWVALGLHPWWVMEMTGAEVRAALAALAVHCEGGKLHAVGELGLDYGPKFKRLENPEECAEIQAMAFERQLNLALDHGLPLVLHIVDAHRDAIRVLKAQMQQRGLSQLRGMVHGFSGSAEIAREYIAMGLKMGIGTAVMGRGFLKLKEAVCVLPLDCLLLETDGPGVYRGLALGPQTLLEVAQAVASLRGLKDSVVLLEQTRATLSSWWC